MCVCLPTLTKRDFMIETKDFVSLLILKKKIKLASRCITHTAG